MSYLRFKGMSFFKQINTEEKARNLVWGSRFGGKDFVCPECKHEEFYQLKTRPEIRKCKSCGHLARLRVTTIFENTKISILQWVRAIYMMMEDKRGVSALELQRRLGFGSYETALVISRKIRGALQQRDERYKLKEIIELDGSGFGNAANDNQKRVLVAIETKSWIDAKGKPKSGAGFAKVMVAEETKANAEEFLNKSVEKGSLVNTDGGMGFVHIDSKDYHHDYQIMDSKRENIDHWLPWVHRFISNAKAWIIGTHHGVRKQYLELYLAEFTYRFNRRHDPDSLFHRALTACSQLDAETSVALFG